MGGEEDRVATKAPSVVIRSHTGRAGVISFTLLGEQAFSISN
jgi:hypothetical protein